MLFRSEMSDDNDSDHHWNQTKKPKLTIPSNLNSLKGIISASANLEDAKDQVSFFFIIFFFRRNFPFVHANYILYDRCVSDCS